MDMKVTSIMGPPDHSTPSSGPDQGTFVLEALLECLHFVQGLQGSSPDLPLSQPGGGEGVGDRTAVPVGFKTSTPSI